MPVTETVKRINGLPRDEQVDHVWNHLAILAILDRPQYCGYDRDSNGRLIPSKVYQPMGITIEDWQGIQAIRARHKRGRGRPPCKPHPLSGLVFCGYCGSPLQIRPALGWGKKTFAYVCPHAYEHAKSDCRKTRIAEQPFIGFAKAFLPLAGAFLPKPTSEKERKTERERLESRKAELLKKGNQLVDMSDLSSETVKRQLTRVAEELKTTEAALAAASEPSTLTLHQPLNPALLTVYSIPLLDGAQLKSALRVTIRKIAVKAESVTVTLANGGEFTLPRPHFHNQRLPPILGMVPGGKQPLPYTVYAPQQSCLRATGLYAKGALGSPVFCWGGGALFMTSVVSRRPYKDEHIRVVSVG